MNLREDLERAGRRVLGADAEDRVRRSTANFVGALSGGGAAEDGETDDDDEDADQPKRGNPRRLSKDARAAQRALRRLRGR